jgi:hypothetical protein
MSCRPALKLYHYRWLVSVGILGARGRGQEGAYIYDATGYLFEKGYNMKRL